MHSVEQRPMRLLCCPPTWANPTELSLRLIWLSQIEKTWHRESGMRAFCGIVLTSKKPRSANICIDTQEKACVGWEGEASKAIQLQKNSGVHATKENA